MNYMMARGYSPAQIEAHEARKARDARMRPQAVAELAPPPPSAQARIAALEAEVAALRARVAAAARNEPRVAAIPIKGRKVTEILQSVALHYGVKETDVLAHRRLPRLVNARQVAMWAARRLTTRTSVQIGQVFKRDYSTVLYGAYRVESQRQDDPAFAAETDALLARLSL